jgi:hypothetical protein
VIKSSGKGARILKIPEAQKQLVGTICDEGHIANAVVGPPLTKAHHPMECSAPVAMRRRFPVLAFLGALAAACSAAGIACYQMNVRTTHLGAIQSASTCDEFLHQQLTGLGYHLVQRVASTYAMFSKDAVLARQTPTSSSAPGTVGGLVGMHLVPRDDGGCLAELVPFTYDCLAAAADGAFVRCELTPGAPSDIEADIAQVASEFRGRFKTQSTVTATGPTGLSFLIYSSPMRDCLRGDPLTKTFTVRGVCLAL